MALPDRRARGRNYGQRKSAGLPGVPGERALLPGARGALVIPSPKPELFVLRQGEFLPRVLAHRFVVVGFWRGAGRSRVAVLLGWKRAARGACTAPAPRVPWGQGGDSGDRVAPLSLRGLAARGGGSVCNRASASVQVPKTKPTGAKNAPNH